MNLDILNDDGSQKRYQISPELYKAEALKNHTGYIDSSSKETSALEILRAYHSDSKAILLDANNKVLFSKLKSLNVEEFSKPSQNLTIFDDIDFLMMFFTSGSTGEPVGAFKTKQNLDEEAKALTKLFKQYQIKKVIVTVPFTHIYGTLLGLVYPLKNGIDIVLKEHFLPHDLLDLIEDNCLVVTTPLYIKALLKLDSSKTLDNTLFVSSTAPLESELAQSFISKYKTNLIQLFGSTETGGIAYKRNDETLWTPLDNVTIETNSENELAVKSPFVSNILYKNGLQQTGGKIETFDYIEKQGERFRLLGRSSKIFKIAGKRYSTIQIENRLEEIAEISKALVFVKESPNSLRGEYLDILLESDRNFSPKEIKRIIQNSFSNLKFSINLTVVDKIPTTQLGKKIPVGLSKKSQ